MHPMMKTLAYRVLCAGTGLGLVIFGFALVLAYFSALGPDASETIAGMSMGPPGLYFMAFTGCALVGWGGSLLAVLRAPSSAGVIGNATTLALVLSALYRMAAWLMSEFPLPGKLPLVEAGVMLLLALAFLWLRPSRADRGRRFA
jgi:hypothetical protein